MLLPSAGWWICERIKALSCYKSPSPPLSIRERLARRQTKTIDQKVESKLQPAPSTVNQGQASLSGPSSPKLEALAQVSSCPQESGHDDYVNNFGLGNGRPSRLVLLLHDAAKIIVLRLYGMQRPAPTLCRPKMARTVPVPLACLWVAVPVLVVQFSSGTVYWRA